ncbi:uncharacterized protein LOC128391911 isoform X2 [Panonychus citri]|uniref:uncharacterized protein LOC128391911 isoform X2 n=1 Tax=Panonychus citri TaxID=50023 RepID=UPI0023077097|nr:uncharacterized protein LOC128391911 isoform X2 [Panonychus citri]
MRILMMVTFSILVFGFVSVFAADEVDNNSGGSGQVEMSSTTPVNNRVPNKDMANKQVDGHDSEDSFDLPTTPGIVPDPNDDGQLSVDMNVADEGNADSNENGDGNNVGNDDGNNGGNGDGNNGGNGDGNGGNGDGNNGGDGDGNGGNGDRTSDGFESCVSSASSSSSSTRRKRKKSRKERRQVPKASIRYNSVLDATAEIKVHNYSVRPDGKVLVGGDYGKFIAEVERITNFDREKTVEISPEEQVTWAKDSSNEKGKTITEQEKEAKERLEKYPVLFGCIYCKTNFTKLWMLKDHVYGKDYGDARKYACIVRCTEEELNRTSIPKTSVPKRFPWGDLICVNPKLWTKTSTGRTSFKVPPNIRKTWVEGMVDERDKSLVGKRGRPRKSTSTTPSE